MGNTRVKAGEQQKPCVVWLDEAHCFGSALFFTQQSLRRPKCPSNYALGSSSPSRAALRSHCLETEHQRWKKSRRWRVAPRSPQGAATLLHQGTFAEHGESSALQEDVNPLQLGA